MKALIESGILLFVGAFLILFGIVFHPMIYWMFTGERLYGGF